MMHGERARILSKDLDSPAFGYVANLIFGRLGLKEVVLKTSSAKQIELEIPDSGRTLRISPFLSGNKPEDLLKTGQLQLCMADTDEFVRGLLFEDKLPILTLKGSSCPTPLVDWSPDSASINFDLFGSAFYILTRAEEMTDTERDSHDRFPAKASHAFKNNYLHRPVVDEYVEILWACMKRLWPQLERKKTEFRMALSHDVDVPFAEAFSSPLRIGRSIAGDLLKRRSPGKAVKRIGSWLAVKRGDWRKDTNYTFDRIMDLSEKYGIRSAFYFKTACTNPKYDDGYSIDHPYLRQLMRDIHSRGHEIGFHASYETYLDPVQTKKEFRKLQKVCEEEGIEQETWGGRQHYLRWNNPITWNNWANAGLTYDSSLAFADYTGFRCGTCHEYLGFDIVKQRISPIVERPLIVMESTLLLSQYMGLNNNGALMEANKLRKNCYRFGGHITILWHNSNLYKHSDCKLYEDILASLYH